MAEPTDARVAVYIDFDNIVISRFNQLHGRSNRVQKIKDLDPRDPATATLLDEAQVDLGSVLDFASSFGTLAISRAYADWSIPVNADYSRQLIERAVDLVQLFPTVSSGKNGADIRLALDAVEDLFRLPHLSHVVIVAGDSDYVALAQRCKQLNRYVVGIGVAGSTSRALAHACNEFKDYDALPGMTVSAPRSPQENRQPKTRRSVKPRNEKDIAADLLIRALQLRAEKTDDEWQSSATTKSQMLRLDPTFQERALGFTNFTDFLQSLDSLVELDTDTSNRKIRTLPRE
ncbi:MAG: NYN domain-containing protein [Rhodoglobus sp.]